MVNEVNLHKSRQAARRNPLRLGKLWLNARRGRWGMRLSQHQRESGQAGEGSGRGWPAQERAVDGW